MKPPRPLLPPSTAVRCALWLALSVAVPAAAEVVERVVAKVNGQIVTLSDFESRQLAAVQTARVGPEQTEKYLRDNNARILQEAIDELLLVQRAAELGFKMRPQYVQEIVEGIKKDNNIATDEELVQQLRREGMSLDELKRNIERSILRRQVLSHDLEGKAAVNEAAARAEYEAKRADYQRPGSVTLREILVKEQAQAAELAARARSGEDFAALAREHSLAPSRAQGGDLGALHRGDLNPALEAAAFALQQGAVSDPVRTADGWRVLQCSARTEPGVVPFEEVKDEIMRRLVVERGNAQYETYMQGLRKAASIDVKVREVPLQVLVPEGGVLDKTPEPAAAVAPASDSEFAVSGSDTAERVAPPAPAPTPSPAPEKQP